MEWREKEKHLWSLMVWCFESLLMIVISRPLPDEEREKKRKKRRRMEKSLIEH